MIPITVRPFTAVNIILSVIGAPLSALPFIVSFRKKIVPNMLYSIYLCIINTLGCIYVLLYQAMINKDNGISPGLGCTLNQIIAYIICVSNISAFTMIAIDRFLVVVKQKILSRGLVLSILGGIFCLSIVLACVPVMVDKSMIIPEASLLQCTPAFWWRGNAGVTVSFVMDMTVIVLSVNTLIGCYFTVWTKYSKIVKQVSLKSKTQQDKEKSLLYSSIITCFTFIVLWTPFLLKIFYEFIGGVDAPDWVDFISFFFVVTSLPATSLCSIFLDYRFYNLYCELFNIRTTERSSNSVSHSNSQHVSARRDSTHRDYS
ncbi:hypothetical protein HDV01_006078 [Terramyces sp. JEL0728]|nr:hypothetical protein HDV01_006078 [Terramyces sp. JEL0728]